MTNKPPEKTRGVYERERGSGTWWVRYADEYGREHREKVGPRGLALAVYRKRKTEVAERRFFPERLKRREVLLRDAIKAMLLRKQHLRSYKDMVRMGALWTTELGERPLRTITADDVARVATLRRAAVAEQTVIHELGFLGSIYRAAIHEGTAERSPVGSVGKPNNARLRYLRDEEEAALFAKLPKRWHDLVLLALHTGMRQGEQFALKWEYVDLANHVIRIPRGKNGTPRIVSLNDTAVAVLKRQPRQLRCAWVFPTGSRKGGATPGKRHLNARNFLQRYFMPALVAASITDFTWHDLRHTFASRLAMMGKDIRTIAELLGHTTIQQAARYAHLSASHRLEAVRALNGHGGATRTGTRTGTGEQA